MDPYSEQPPPQSEDPADTEQQPVPPSVREFLRQRWRLAAVVAAVLLVAGVAAGILVSAAAGGDDWEYDEAAHRRVLEAAYGEDYFINWPQYRDTWLEICAETTDLALTEAVFIDGGTSATEFELNIRYTCPDRLEELPPHSYWD